MAELPKTSREENNTATSFLLKKTEAIIAAIYLLSGLLSDQEPAKWRLRGIGANIIETAVSFFANGIAAEASSNSSRAIIERDAALLCSYLEVLTRGRALSEKNVELVRREIELWAQIFGETLAGGAGKIHEDMETLLAMPPRGQSMLKTSPRSHERQSGSVRPAALQKTRGGSLIENDAQGMLLKNVAVTAPPRHMQPSSLNGKRLVRSSREGEQRRGVILDLVRAKGWVRAKDVARLLPQYSGKTAQRELISLVGEGVLRREGARRWSRYALNNLHNILETKA